MSIPPNVSPPYYAVIFSSKKKKNDPEFSKLSEYLDELVTKQDGYLGHENYGEDPAVTISYWKDLESIKKWRNEPEHANAMKRSIKEWFAAYRTQVAKVERNYFWEDK